MKKLIISICTLALATALLGASTFAWFSMNRTVSVKGMSVTAQADSSLVITKYINSTDTVLPAATTTDSIATFTTATKTLFASTHDLTDTENTLNYSTGLKYITNPEKVDLSTGTISSANESAIVWANASDSKNYIDYTVYIASAGSSKSTNLQIEDPPDTTF